MEIIIRTVTITRPQTISTYLYEKCQNKIQAMKSVRFYDLNRQHFKT